MKDLSLQQKALWYAALYKDPEAPVDYVLDKSKTLKKTIKTQKEVEILLKKFSSNPKDTLAYCRQAIQYISSDKKLSDAQRKERTSRYIDQYLDLIIELDQQSFTHDNQKTYNGLVDGIPSYIPDNFVDMWSDYNTNNEYRNREKIVVNKQKLFAEAYQLLHKVLGTPWMTKRDIVNHIYYYVAQRPYSHNTAQGSLWWNSVPLDEIIGNDDMVCRHKALWFQILVQTCGLTSQLLKCTVKFWNTDRESHVANLVRVDYKWYLVDPTAPIEGLDGKVRYAINPIKEKEINVNKQTYTWYVGENIKKPRTYVSRNNMYYQIK